MISLADALHHLRVLISFILIPPAGLIWVALAGFVLTARWRRAGRVLLATGLIGLFLLGLPAVSDLLNQGLERAVPSATRVSPPGAIPGAIIVLGGDGRSVRGGARLAEPGPLSLERLAGAAALARRTGLPVLITGGGVAWDQPPVSDMMADALRDEFGIEARWREEHSLDTCENAALSAAMLRHDGIGSAYVVTHAWHMRRALLDFARAGYPVIPAPLPADVLRGPNLFDLMPQVKAWTRSYYAIHEWLGLLAAWMGDCPPAFVTPDGPA